MPPIHGNAFAQQKEAERLKQVQKHFENDAQSSPAPTFGPLTEEQSRALATANDDGIKITILEVPTTQNDAPSTAGTTMAAIIGPETEREKHGRKLVQQQRESMEAKINRNRSRKSRRSTNSSRGTVKHPSAMPAPLFRGKFGKVIDIFKRTENAATTNGALDKPLPVISSPEAAYARAHGTYIPGAYIPSPPSIQGGAAMQGSPPFGQYPRIPFNPGAQPFYPDQYAQSQPTYAEQGWPVPVEDNTTGRLSAQPFEINPSQYLSTGNEGMIFSNHFLTPTRAGDFAAFGQPRVVHPPSMMSMAASFIDPQSPINPQAGQPESARGVLPEVQETKALQVAHASDVEKLYNKRSEESQSDKSPVRVRPNFDDPPTSTTAVATSAPRVPRSRSLPNMSISNFAIDPAAVTRRASTGTNIIFDHSTPPVAAAPVEPYIPSSPVAAAAVATARMLEQLYAQLCTDLKNLQGDLSARITTNRKSTAKDLVVLHDQIKSLGRDDTLAFLQSRMHTIETRSQRIEDKLDAVIDALSLRSEVSRRMPDGVSRGAGMEGRLVAPGPHTPWGSLSLNMREREPSAGIGGGLEGAQAWYRAARRA